ncbi:methyltransferase [Geobacter sp. DSM 9736]|uniref:methyltransferase n=1 Tax=Geobacter sp. DSM 9736 TaxID=1277350 RepID=UPI000B4FE118|nr:methyltransferase [Geobacter sp. DSM 9736]SNB45663.1 Dimerisation domain-containing protein [Geobacter sp. DSM 9736]
MEQKQWTPADLLQLSGSYWSACALHAGVKLDVFTKLAGKRQTANELAILLACDPRGTAMLLDALTAMKLTEKEEGSYSASAFADRFLSRLSDEYLGHIILHHHHLMESWSRLDEGIRQGGPVRDRVSHNDDDIARESFLMGMFNLAMQLAPRIVSAVDLSGRRKLLDMGGGPGTYAIQFCLHNPTLEAVIFDLPTTRKFAEGTVSRFGLSNRITFQQGDFIEDEITGSYDVVWLSHVLHSEGPEGCAVLLGKTIGVLEPGALVLIQEFILDDAMDGPLFPALFSLNMLLNTPSGQAYSQGQLFRMLEAAGLVDVKRLPIDLPNGAGIISGIFTGRS